MKQEISMLPTSCNDVPATSDDSNYAPEVTDSNAQHPISLTDEKSVFKPFKSNVSAEIDIAEGFHLGPPNSFEEQSQCSTSLQEQYHMQGNGSQPRVVDTVQLEAQEESLEEKNKVIQQQSQMISDPLCIVDSLKPPNAKSKDNRTLSYTAATSHEGGWHEGRVAQMEKSLEELTRQTTVLKCHIRELEMQLQASLASTHTGSFLWRVPDVPWRKRDAIEERITSIYSPPFYTGR